MHFSELFCKLQNDEKWKCARQKFCAALLLSSQIMFGPSFFFVFFLDQKWSSEAQKWCRKVDKSFDRQLLCVSFQPFVLSQLSAAIVLLGFPQCVKISFFVRKFNMLKTCIKKRQFDFILPKLAIFIQISALFKMVKKKINKNMCFDTVCCLTHAPAFSQSNSAKTDFCISRKIESRNHRKKHRALLLLWIVSRLFH